MGVAHDAATSSHSPSSPAVVPQVHVEDAEAEAMEVELVRTGGACAEHEPEAASALPPPDNADGNASRRRSDGSGYEGSAEAAATATATTVVSVSELVYSIESYNAIYKPVLITMVLSALAVVYINTPESRAQGEASLSNSYNVYGNAADAGNSDSQKLSAAVVNALVIVAVVCALTFAIVLLYKYRCMKILLGYMVLATAVLLGYLSAVMFSVAIDRYSLCVDKISFYLFVYNFAAVGTASIFYGKGIPKCVTQGYLVANSVLVAWQLSFFDPWTAWALLVVLALYDLFAVLTPCGPLKALVRLMQRDDAPDVPGLLYEAPLPLPGGRRRREDDAETTRRARTLADRAQMPTPVGSESARGPKSGITSSPVGDNDSSAATIVVENQTCSDSNNRPTAPAVSLPDDGGVDTAVAEIAEEKKDEDGDGDGNAEPAEPDDDATTAVPPTQLPGATALVPLVLAKMYKLPLVDNPRPRWLADPSSTNPSSGENEARDDGGDATTGAPASELPPSYTPEELRSLVHAVFPSGGGRIEPQEEEEPTPGAAAAQQRVRYCVLDRFGNVRRVLVVDDEGKVFQVVQNDATVNGEGRENGGASPRNNSIRLGLGDFIFYSVLVSEAAVYGFLTFAVCTLVLLSGLGLTLLLLAINGKALPALPISIFLGVIFYLATRYFIEPWVHAIFLADVYV